MLFLCVGLLASPPAADNARIEARWPAGSRRLGTAQPSSKGPVAAGASGAGRPVAGRTAVRSTILPLALH